MIPDMSKPPRVDAVCVQVLGGLSPDDRVHAGAYLNVNVNYSHLHLHLHTCVTQRKQHRPGIASNDNTIHAATARRRADLTTPSQTPK